MQRFCCISNNYTIDVPERKCDFSLQKREKLCYTRTQKAISGGGCRMLVYNVTFQCRPGQRETFLEALRAEGIDAASRAEEGNLQYDWFRAVDAPDDLLLIEKYRDEAAVAAHVRSAHVARLVELKERYVDELILEQYECPTEERK